MKELMAAGFGHFEDVEPEEPAPAEEPKTQAQVMKELMAAGFGHVEEVEDEEPRGGGGLEAPQWGSHLGAGQYGNSSTGFKSNALMSARDREMEVTLPTAAPTPREQEQDSCIRTGQLYQNRAAVSEQGSCIRTGQLYQNRAALSEQGSCIRTGQLYEQQCPSV